MQRSLPSLETLPPEQSGQSLKFVRPPDLCNLALASSKMRELVDSLPFWSGIRLKKETIKREGLDQLFSINRFMKIRQIDLSNMTFTRRELRRNLNAIKTSSVKDLNLKYVDVSKVPPELLGQAANHLYKIDLTGTRLSTEQCIAVLEACVSSAELLDVSLAFINVREVPAELLGQAAKHLHKINLDGTTKTNLHCIAVLEACVSSAKLVDVSLAYSDLREVPADLLGEAAHHLHNINLNSTKITKLHCLAVLEACVSSANLVHVSLVSFMFLHEVPAQLLGEAAHHLHKINLSSTVITNLHCLAVLEACVSSHNLVDVSLVQTDLHEVPAELLGRAAHHLHNMDLTSTKLNTEHCIAVLEACISSAKLVDVSLVWADLREVQIELLGQAVHHLHRMNLRSAELTTEQCIAVLEACISGVLFLL